jgi:hypothetical protein
MPQIKKLPIIILLSLVLFVMVSCNNNAEPTGGVVIQVPDDTSALAKIDHYIPGTAIKEYQAAFNRERDTLQKLRPGFAVPLSESFNKKAVIKLLQLPGCVGIKVLYGIKQGGNANGMRLILVGVDSQGNNLFLKGNEGISIAADEPAAKKSDSGTAPKLMSKPLGDTSGGIEQGQCDPPCPKY